MIGVGWFLSMSGNSTGETGSMGEEIEVDENGNETDEQLEEEEVDNKEKREEIETLSMGPDREVILSFSDHEEAINYQSGQEERANEIIMILHDKFNDLTGWGALEAINWESHRSGDSSFNIELFRELTYELENEMLAESRALHDIRNLVTLYDLAHWEEANDMRALRYAHRIIHDLDNSINGARGDETIYGVTEAFGERRNIQDIYDYIRNRLE